MEALNPPDACFSPTPSFAQNASLTRPSIRSPPHLTPLPEEADSQAESQNGSAFRVVSLNLGGRNTNPVEFEIKGDNSEMAAEVTSILRRSGKAIKSAEEGPLLMPASEMEVVLEILAEIFKEPLGAEKTEWHSRIHNLLRCETWAQVLASVRAISPYLFNTLNLYTLKLSRPSVWEDPSSCKDFTNTKEYLLTWKQWYTGLDRSSQFWLEHAPRAASKRGLEVPAAFAGLLLFDVMCLCCARFSMRSGDKEDDCLDDAAEDTREVPFKQIARLAESLPSSSLAARHAFAQAITQGTHALLAQEARSFADHPTMAEEYSPPFCAPDGFTAIFLRKGSFTEATDIGAAVAKRLQVCIDAEPSPDVQRAWRTTASRLAAVSCECQAELGGFRACLVSLHASKSDYTAGFVLTLRDILADYDADINVVGMDSNCASQEVVQFQKTLCGAGIDVGCTSRQQQVTVAKQRTAFQTQTRKVGEVDISHKDYILTWTSPRVRRDRTTYTPDLRTSYGVEQETKQCVRLPMTKWPFDHCSVATSFQRKHTLKESMRCGQRSLFAAVIGMLMLLVLLSPFASRERAGPYGRPGLWFHDGFSNERRFGICEAPAPCPLDDWVQAGSSCYKTTPKLGYPDLQRYCQNIGGAPVAIGSDEENQLMLRSLCPKGDFCYIGLLGDFTGRGYWDSGETLNYTRLVEADMSFLPLWEQSRSTEYRVTLLSNMPGEAIGCDVRYTFTFRGGSASPLDFVVEYVAPAFAMVFSGVLLSLRRPPGQWLAEYLLFTAFCSNLLWAAHKMLNACYVDSFYLHLTVTVFGRLISSSGVAGTSFIGVWMIIRRMGVLYPSGGFKQLFVAMLTSASLCAVVTTLFIDSQSPMGATWAVLLSLATAAVTCLLYVVIALRAYMYLYNTWVCLRNESTSGYSSRSTMLTEQTRAARFHLLAVPLATLCGAARVGILVLIGVLDISWADYTSYALSRIYMLSMLLDSVTNDFCAHVLAAMNMDEAVVRAKGVTTEVAERSEREVEQHRLAVRMLKAAPTSVEQLQQLAVLEGKAVAALGTQQEVSAFLILQSAVRVETARIHRLMQCVRLRAMTMQVRYQFLIEVPALDGSPRQHVPDELAAGGESQAAGDKYFNWLYAEAAGAQQVLFQQVQRLLAKFNTTAWPSDLGLAPEEFPWKIWANSYDQKSGKNRLQKDDVISPGSTLIHSPPRTSCLAQDPSALCIVLEETSPDHVLVHRSGMQSSEQVLRDDLRSCRSGGGLFIPGPQKKQQRSLDKIAVDYEDSSEWPAAASLVDICRCMLVCDDPYAMAVLVAYVRENMEVVRLKNRFSEDIVESHGAGELQTMFYATGASDASASETQTTTSVHRSSSEYRDISMNVRIRTPNGVPFVCEIQVTLSNLAILKHADQQLYTVRRMKSPWELEKARTFGKEVCVADRHTDMAQLVAEGWRPQLAPALRPHACPQTPAACGDEDLEPCDAVGCGRADKQGGEMDNAAEG